MEINKALEIITNSDDLYDGYGYLTKLGYEALAVLNGADVVEVIRCEGCKHNVINHGRYCVFGDCSGCLVADDFFCKNGERKETND